MASYFDTYCPECDEEVRAEIKARGASLPVRGENVDFCENVACCPNCGQVIGDARIEEENLERAYSAYRVKHGIMSPDEIRQMREGYCLSLREFSKFLGFGEQTAYRYERGDIPDQAHSNALLSAKTLAGAKHLLAQNRSRLTLKSISSIERHILTMAEGASSGLRLHSEIEAREGDAPSVANGFRRLDFGRVCALVCLLAVKCSDLYWTKLQKAMFFADMLCFERRSCSLTGLTYAHATYGPVMDCMDELRLLLVSQGVIKFKQNGWGEIVVPLDFDDTLFNEEEIALIDEVSEFVNSFSTASDLSGYSHRLSCWSDSVDGEIISYSYTEGEIEKSISQRMTKA